MCLLSMRRLAAIFRLSWRFLAINLAIVSPFTSERTRSDGGLSGVAQPRIAETGIKETIFNKPWSFWKLEAAPQPI
jgi:hypothetical protein